MRQLRFVLLALALLPATLPAQLHQFNSRDRQRARTMLSVVADDVRDQYWDPRLKGLPFDSMVAAADSILRTATDYGQVNGVIARLLMALDDSHTRYLPPMGVNTIRIGWEPYAIGDSVYLGAVDMWARAAPIGLQVGDRLVAIDGWRVERRRINDLLYVRRFVQPLESMELTIETPAGQVRRVSVPVQVIPGRQYYDLSRLGGGSDWYQLIRERQAADSGWDSRFASPDSATLYWRLRSFMVSDDHIRDGLRRARDKQNLILDLRGNSGGYVSTLDYLLARVARPEHVGRTLYRRIDRDGADATIVEEAAARQRWNGRLIVLIDSESMSAAEAFADAVQQLELGTVIGDRSPGFLTEALVKSHITNEATTVFYGASIAVAMLERPDGSRIEGIGVTPDEFVLPTPTDLQLDRDPALARALQIVGQPYDPTRAAAYRAFGEVNTVDR